MRDRERTTARGGRTPPLGRTESGWRFDPLRLALALVLVLGCEARFVDPYPPDIRRLSREHTLKVVDAPMVYGLIFDLNIPNAAECSRIKARLAATFRSVLLPPGRVGMEMQEQDLSPGCVQLSTRQFSTLPYDQQLLAAETRFGTRRVKPLLIYFNNVELPAPSAQSAFAQLRTRTLGVPLVWALATPEATQGIVFDKTAPWTYSTDPGLTAPLEGAARTQLPLLHHEQPPVEGYPLFTPQELTWVLEFKACTFNNSLSGTNFTYGSQAVRLDATRPPRIRVSIPSPQVPVPRDGKIQPLEIRYELEVCRAYCDRLFEPSPREEPVIWNTTPRCLLKSAT